GILRRLEAFVASPIGCGEVDVGNSLMRHLFIRIENLVRRNDKGVCYAEPSYTAFHI
ncbi:hypothetical protein Tco_0427972, partial [Tanacetum coccineum]